MQERDIENYDYLSVTLKKSTEEQLLRCYRALGWEQTEASEDKVYVDITHYEMRRSHFIENKDKLLLLQVRVESEVNKMAKIAVKRHRKSTVFAIVFGIFALGCAAAGVFLMAWFRTVLFYALGGALCGVCLLVCLASVFITRRLIEWENGVCESELRGCMARLKDLFTRIENITGVKDGRQG